MIPISDPLAQALNEQVTREIANKHLYRMFSSWCHVRGLKNIEKFFAGESEGEQGHANLLMGILDDANIQIAIPSLPAKPSVFTSCEDIANTYERAEVETTDFLEALYRAAEKEGNVGVSNLLQTMLQEQIEEQGLTERFKNLVTQAGGNLLLLDLMFAE
jgi:ferritin